MLYSGRKSDKEVNEKVGIDEKKNEKRNKNEKIGEMKEESVTTEGGKKKGKKKEKEEEENKVRNRRTAHRVQMIRRLERECDPRGPYPRTRREIGTERRWRRQRRLSNPHPCERLLKPFSYHCSCFIYLPTCLPYLHPFLLTVQRITLSFPLPSFVSFSLLHSFQRSFYSSVSCDCFFVPSSRCCHLTFCHFFPSNIRINEFSDFLRSSFNFSEILSVECEPIINVI